jgi:hypothetical protein
MKAFVLVIRICVVESIGMYDPKILTGCFSHSVPLAWKKTHVNLHDYDEYQGYNPSIVKYDNGFLVSKRKDWVNGCGIRTKGRSRATIFLKFDENLTIDRLLHIQENMVDARLIENQNRLLLTYLPTKVSECAICTWNTHISLLSHVFASKCRDVQSFCGNGRNHAVHSKDLGISSLEPRVSFWHNRVWARTSRKGQVHAFRISVHSLFLFMESGCFVVPTRTRVVFFFKWDVLQRECTILFGIHRIIPKRRVHYHIWGKRLLFQSSSCESR